MLAGKLRMAPTCYHVLHLMPVMAAHENNFFIEEGLRDEYGQGGFLHFGQGKWYPGEPLPRWALGCFWRPDGQPLWQDERLIAETGRDYGAGPEQAHEVWDEIETADRQDTLGFYTAKDDRWTLATVTPAPETTNAAHGGGVRSGRIPGNPSGRYWARTSDPQLVELVLSQLS